MNDVARELLKIANILASDEAEIMRASKQFMVEMQRMLDRHFEEKFPGQGAQLKMSQGKRYIRIASLRMQNGKVVDRQGSAWAFIDKTNGDILKPASWKKPAKHARGNVLDKSSWKKMTPYGPQYLR